MQASFTVHPLTPASAKRAALSERVAGCIPTSLWLALQRAFLEIKLLWQLTKRGFFWIYEWLRRLIYGERGQQHVRWTWGWGNGFIATLRAAWKVRESLYPLFGTMTVSWSYSLCLRLVSARYCESKVFPRSSVATLRHGWFHRLHFCVPSSIRYEVMLARCR